MVGSCILVVANGCLRELKEGKKMTRRSGVRNTSSSCERPLRGQDMK